MFLSLQYPVSAGGVVVVTGGVVVVDGGVVTGGVVVVDGGVEDSPFNFANISTGVSDGSASL